METQDLPTIPIFWAEEGIVMSPVGGQLRVTSGVEFSGLKKEANFDFFNNKIHNIKQAFVGEVGEVTAQWLGFRPSMPDSLPVIGRTDRYKNAFLAFGHGHLGLTLGPVTGKIIADLISNRTVSINLTPYRPSRFKLKEKSS